MWGESPSRRWDNVRWQVVSFPNPAAGAELDLRAAGLGPWRLWSLSFLFTASAAVANRTPTFTWDQDALTILRLPSTVVIAAAGTARYQGMMNGAGLAAVAGVNFLLWPDWGIVLRAGDHFRSVTANIDVADQYSQIVALVEEIPLEDSAMAEQETVAEFAQYGTFS
jgi:hypothetical protein